MLSKARVRLSCVEEQRDPHRARAHKSDFRRLMRRQISPRQRVARFGNHVDVRQAGLLRFLARFRLVFTVCFVSPFAFPRWRGTGGRSRGPAIFTARRRRFFFFFSFLRSRSRLARRRRYERRDILATSDTSLGSHNIPLSSAAASRSSFLPSSFLPSLLPSVVSTPLQRVSLHDLSLSSSSRLFPPR